MKKLILMAIVIITGLTIQIKAQDYYDRGYNNGYNNDGFGYFYTSLSPYGSWVEFGDGVYGWKPVGVGNAWAPYADGQWVWTSDGWYWDSYEPYGYIVYHYGRWYFDDYYGWVWIPDYQWAPAWVEWRYDDNYIGWTPLPPYAVFSISVGIQFTHVYTSPYSRWHFVKYNYFCDPYVGKYFVGPQYKYRIYSGTKYRDDYGYRNGRVVNRGIDVNIIRQRGKVDIRERNIRTVSGLRDINNGNRITNNEVRTFIPDKKNFTGAKVKDVKIERTTRKTTLETSKLEFGRNINNRETPVKTNNNTSTREVQKKNNNVKIERNTTGGNVNQNRNPEQKKIVPDTRTKNTDRKVVKSPVQKTPERKNSPTLAPVRTETKQNVGNKTNDRVIKKNTRTVTGSRTPPVDKNNKVRGTSGNSGNQKQENKGNDRSGRK